MPVARPDSPVTLVEGIGPAAAEGLARIGVHHVFDLLRAGEEDLHGVLAGLASLEEVRRWRAAAALLQVEGLTNQWAEALVSAGVTSVEELHRADAASLRAALDAAVAEGRSPDAPDDPTLAELRVDAAVLAWSGALDVTVRDADDAPLAGAEVRVGERRAETDAHGRARLTRIPLGTPARLTVSLDGFASELRDLTQLQLDEFQLGVELVRLAPAPLSAVRLREYDGDLLPPLSVHAMTTEARDGSALRERDVLILRRRYDDGTTAQLTSKFLEYEGGRFIAVSYRVPLDRLPPDAELRQHFLVRSGALTRVTMNSQRLRHHKAARRARAALAGHAPPQTLVEKEAFLFAYAERLQAELALGGGGAP